MSNFIKGWRLHPLVNLQRPGGRAHFFERQRFPESVWPNSFSVRSKCGIEVDVGAATGELVEPGDAPKCKICIRRLP